MNRLDFKRAINGSLLEKSNSNNIDHSHEETKGKSNDQNDFLFEWKAHFSQKRHRKEENGEIGDDIHRGGREVQGNNVDAMRVGRDVGKKHGVERITLEHIDKCQCEARCIYDSQGDEVRPSKDFLVSCQGQVEDKDRGLDGH